MNISQLCKCWAEVLARYTNSIYDKLARPFDSFETKQWLSSLCLFLNYKITFLFFYHFE